MLIDRTHQTWAMISIVVLALATGLFVFVTMTSPTMPSGGTVIGLGYGIAGSAMMIFAGLLAARKQVPAWWLGSAQFWLRGHIWLGTLSFPLILFHSGFGWGGLLENLLWIAFATVILSGFFGLVVQNFLPRMLTAQVSRETFPSQIPYLCNRMQFLSDKTVAEHVAKKCGKLEVEYQPLKQDAKEVARKEGWLKRDGDFEKLLHNTYESAPAYSKPKPPSPAESNPLKPKVLARSAASPLDQLSSSTVAAGTEDSTKQTESPKSPLELARATKSPESKSGPTATNAKSVRNKPEVSKLAVSRTPAATASSVRLPKDVSAARMDDLKTFYLETVRPLLGQRSAVAGTLREDADLRLTFSKMRDLLPVELHDTLEQLELFCNDRRQFKIQTRIHRWLHCWLFLHIPISMVLFVLFVAHVVMSLRVVPF